MNVQTVRESLSIEGRNLLKILVTRARGKTFEAGKPETYIGYKECCELLGVVQPGMVDVQWGRLLQRHGLNDLNEWTKQNNLPRITGLIVNQGGDRAYRPGGDFFKSNGRNVMDFPWWEQEVAAAAKFNWRPYV